MVLYNEINSLGKSYFENCIGSTPLSRYFFSIFVKSYPSNKSEGFLFLSLHIRINVSKDFLPHLEYTSSKSNFTRYQPRSTHSSGFFLFFGNNGVHLSTSDQKYHRHFLSFPKDMEEGIKDKILY